MRKGLHAWGASWSRLPLLVGLTTFCACSGGNDLPLVVRHITDEPVVGGQELLTQPSRYLLGPGDVMRVTYLGENNLDSNIRVNSDGRIMMPLLDTPILASGLAIEQLKQETEKALSHYLVNPQVFLHITEQGSQQVFVLGQVMNPHLATADPLTLVSVISECGGLTKDGQKKQIFVIRRVPDGDPIVFEVDFMKLLKGESLIPDIPLQRYDIVVVPKSRVAKVRDFMMAAFGNNIVGTRFAIDAILVQDALEEKLGLYYTR